MKKRLIATHGQATTGARSPSVWVKNNGGTHALKEKRRRHACKDKKREPNRDENYENLRARRVVTFFSHHPAQPFDRAIINNNFGSHVVSHHFHIVHDVPGNTHTKGVKQKGGYKMSTLMEPVREGAGA